MAENPGQRPRHVLAAYLARIEWKAYRGSCICHDEQGCRLPHAMRSDTCNKFECSALRRIAEEFPDDRPQRAFVAAVENDRIVRFAFLDGSAQRTCIHPVEPGSAHYEPSSTGAFDGSCVRENT